MAELAWPPLHLTVLTPAEELLDVPEAYWVQLPLADGGGIGIWRGHAPLLAETVAGTLRYADREGEHAQKIEAGILEVSRDEVTVLTIASTGREQQEGPVEAGTEPVRFRRLTRALLLALNGTVERKYEEGGA